MRITSQDNAAFFSLKRTGIDAGGSVRARVRLKGHGFEGSNRSVYFDREAIKGFRAELEQLERNRQGNASLISLSPGECVFTIGAVDRLGHIHVKGAVRKVVLRFGEIDHFECRLRFEIDPTRLPHLLRELSEELVVRLV